MSEQSKQGTALIALVLGLIGAVAPFTYFLMALGFLSLPGLFLAIAAYKRTKTGLSKISLGVNIVSVAIFVSFVVAINYSDYKSSKTVYEYYLPKNYNGWVIIKENQKSAAPITLIPDFPGGRYKIIIPETGRIETSGSLNDWHTTKYFWYSAGDTIEFKPETGLWGDSTYKSLVHCSGGSENTLHFFISDIPREPQDTVILKACETLYELLKEN